MQSSSLEYRLFHSDPETYHTVFNHTVSWQLPSNELIEHFNPLMKDCTGKNFYEAYCTKFVTILSSLLDTGSADIYNSYKALLASKWVKIPAGAYWHVFSRLAVKMYGVGIRDANELIMSDFLSYSEEARPLFKFRIVLHCQFAELNYNENEAFTPETIEYMRTPSHAHAGILAFIDEMKSFMIGNIRPFPACFKEYILSTNDRAVIKGLLETYEITFYEEFSECIHGKEEEIVLMSLENGIPIHHEFLNAYYSENPMLLHTIIRYTTSASDCLAYIHDLNNIQAAIQNDDGRTPLMNYIVKYKTLPPASLLHDPEIRDVDGKTCQDLWAFHIDRYTIPDSIRVMIYDKLVGGCEHVESYTYSHEGKLYCEECSSEMEDREKIYAGERCPICYEEYTRETQFAKYKSCSHVICENCVKNTSECPFCRK